MKGKERKCEAGGSVNTFGYFAVNLLSTLHNLKIISIIHSLLNGCKAFSFASTLQCLIRILLFAKKTINKVFILGK
jgi:hypothetical protein